MSVAGVKYVLVGQCIFIGSCTIYTTSGSFLEFEIVKYDTHTRKKKKKSINHDRTRNTALKHVRIVVTFSFGLNQCFIVQLKKEKNKNGGVGGGGGGGERDSNWNLKSSQGERKEKENPCV